MASGAVGASDAGWARTREPLDARTVVRMVLGFAAILVIVLAGLALLNSFFVELAPGQPDPDPGGGDEGDPGGGGDGPRCETFERTFYWIFVVLLVAAVALFGVAVALRERNGGRIGSSIWGILSVVAAFLAVMSFGAWRILRAICDGALTCGSANDSTYSSFLFLLILTLAAFGIGIAFSHMQRRNFLGTGWGLLGLLMFLPTILTGLAWFVFRTFCTPDLSCAARDDFLSGLALVFWLGLAGGAVALGVGLFVQKRYAHGIFKSGWGILAILLGLLAVSAGGGYLFVDSLVIPGCDPIEEPEDEEPKTCEEIRSDLQGRITSAMLVVLLLIVGLTVAGMIVYRRDLKRFWTSPFAIVAYIALVLLVILGFGYLLAGTMCGEGEEGDGDSGDGDGDGDQGGNNGGGDQGGGNQGGGGGNQGGGSGNQGGPGGGGGGTGTSNPVTQPIQIDPRSLTWLLIAILAIVGIAAVVVLLRWRDGKLKGSDAGGVLAADSVQARGRQDVMKLLAQGKLAGADQVIAAYRAFVDWSASRGLPIRLDETSREHSQRVAAEYAVPPDAMGDFITAYEVARLSQRLPSAAQREHAVRFAQGLRSREGVEPE